MDRFRKIFRKGTIRKRLLIAFILLVLLPIFAVSTTSIIIGFKNGAKNIEAQLTSVAVLKTSEVKSWVGKLERDLLLFEEICLLSEIISGDDSGRTGTIRGSPSANTHFENFQKIFSITGTFEEVFVLSPSGRVILSTQENSDLGQFRGLQSYFRQGLKSPGVHVQTVSFSSRAEKINTVVAVLPLKDEQGNPLGVLCGRASLEKLQEIMMERTGLGNTGETYLVGENHVLLTTSRFEGYEAGSIHMNTVGVEAALDRKENGFGLYHDYRGVPVVGVYRWIEKLDVALLSEVDQAEAFRATYLMLFTNAAVAALAVVIAGAASVFFTRAIADPLEELSETATRIARGGFHLAAPEKQTDEVGELAKAFNSMTAQLNRRIEMRKLLTDISRQFINITIPEINPTITVSLERFAQFYNADRAYIFQVSSDGDYIGNTHEWCRDGVSSQSSRLDRLPIDSFSWFMSKIKAMELVHVPSVERLPLAAAAERAEWKYESIESLLCIPMAHGGKFIGFLGFDFLSPHAVELSEEDEHFLRMVAEIICNALERKRTESELWHSRKQYALAQRAANIGSWRLDLQTMQLEWSEITWKILGREKNHFNANLDSFIQLVHPEDRDRLKQAIDACVNHDENYDIEHRIIMSNGDIRWVSETGGAIRDPFGKPIQILGMIRDITERKAATEQVRASLREKEVLLREIHHRVKNNLQVISSLLYLQSKKIKDKAALDIFRDCENRVRSMALVHERLYQSDSLTRIDFAEYVRGLTGFLFSAYGAQNSSVRLETRIENIFLSVNKAIPSGLIINELVSNALKHAFVDNRKGKIVITLEKNSNNTLTQSVADNGVGLPPAMDIEKSDTLGLRLVRTLVDQINGRWTLHSDGGTCFSVSFSDDNPISTTNPDKIERS